jgi:hypothetical protein
MATPDIIFNSQASSIYDVISEMFYREYARLGIKLLIKFTTTFLSLNRNAVWNKEHTIKLIYFYQNFRKAFSNTNECNKGKKTKVKLSLYLIN